MFRHRRLFKSFLSQNRNVLPYHKNREPFKLLQILSVTTRLPPSSQSKMVLETKTAVKRLAINPITNVTANPLTGPVPNRNRKAQETTVVTCVSIMVRK